MMKEKYTISVVLACYRGEPYLARQLESLLNQSMVPDEILLCDDSPDSLSRELAAQYPRVRILVNDPPLGVAANFARGIAEAQGDLIFLCDQDDVWLPDKIRHMVHALGDAAGVFCNSTLTDEELKPLGRDHWAMRGFPGRELAELRKGVSPERMQELFCRRVLPAGHDMMFRASCREKILPMPELAACHDSWIGIAVAYCGSWNVCDEELTLFRQHRSNLSGMGRLSPWQEAKKSVQDNTFAWSAALYREAYNRFGDEKLLARAEHSGARSAMNVPLWRRLPLVWKQWVSGNYRRFGRGWKNVVQDIFFR
ncbi:MAG: glycosyltransferase [Lentisphaeria bacterium]|nr:glycosyltransferase [Lentisphaeria bacterium]